MVNQDWTVRPYLEQPPPDLNQGFCVFTLREFGWLAPSVLVYFEDIDGQWAVEVRGYGEAAGTQAERAGLGCRPGDRSDFGERVCAADDQKRFACLDAAKEREEVALQVLHADDTHTLIVTGFGDRTSCAMASARAEPGREREKTRFAAHNGKHTHRSPSKLERHRGRKDSPRRRRERIGWENEVGSERTEVGTVNDRIEAGVEDPGGRTLLQEGPVRLGDAEPRDSGCAKPVSESRVGIRIRDGPAGGTGQRDELIPGHDSGTDRCLGLGQEGCRVTRPRPDQNRYERGEVGIALLPGATRGVPSRPGPRSTAPAGRMPRRGRGAPRVARLECSRQPVVSMGRVERPGSIG